MTLDKQKQIEMYRTMVRIRTFEERLRREFAKGGVPGFIHLCDGQEAIAAGTCANLRPDDYITSTHRGNGHCIAKGMLTASLMAELYAKKTGCSKGKGGQMHCSDMKFGILGTNGIVGGQIPIAGGAALSVKIRKTDQVAVCFLTDGSSNCSRFHEGINLAAIWNLPVVYVLENNGLAITTRISYSCKLTNLSDRAAAYGIPGVTVDGNDVEVVHEAVAEAVARARRGEGPTIVECKTIRGADVFEGEEDAKTYRTKDEMEEIKKKDPIPRYRINLIERGILTREQVDEIEREALEEMDKAVNFAEESAFPSAEETLEGVFV
ncbi:thiamine pyrophosphate-dependent dehydrogenase E1 component subunit alpha [Chloroflexota bacterium]